MKLKKNTSGKRSNGTWEANVVNPPPRPHPPRPPRPRPLLAISTQNPIPSADVSTTKEEFTKQQNLFRWWPTVEEAKGGGGGDGGDGGDAVCDADCRVSNSFSLLLCEFNE